MALDVFLSIPGIPGESQDVNFQGTIVTPSYQWGLAHEVSVAPSGGSGKTTFEPLTVQKNFDVASPLLFKALVEGQEIAAMTLLVAKAGDGAASASPFLIYEFQDVFVTSVEDSGSVGGGGSPAESVTFVFGTYQLRYRATEPDGSLSPTVISSSWSVLTNSVPTGPAPR